MSAASKRATTSSSENLWDLAATRLSDKDKAYLDLSSTTKLDDLLLAVSSRRQECEQRQWTVKKTVLRDIFAKIAKWVEKFIQVGDVAVQYDPGHAALPWAALRFLLKVSVQDVQRYAIVVEGAEKIAKIVLQHRITERLYLRKQYETTTQLKECITDLYVLVLIFLVKAKKFYMKSSTIRALRSIADFNNKFQGYLDSISKQEQDLIRHIALLDSEYSQNVEQDLAALSLEEKTNHQHLKSVLNDLQKPIDRIERNLQYLQDDLSEAKRIQILRWLSPLPYEQYHNQARRDVMAGTGNWFLNDDQLLAWRVSSSSSIMWLRGIAGSGKSKLMWVAFTLPQDALSLNAARSIFIEQQMNEFHEHRNPNPIYFYCARNPAEPERAKPDAILRSLLRQLSCLSPGEAILEPIRTMYKARERTAFAADALSLEESRDLIVALSQYRGLTTIIIDALDECEPVLRDDLLGALSIILQRSNGLIKILVSSRDERDIVCCLAGCLNLEIKATDNQEDIDRFVDSKVDKLIQEKKILYGNVPGDLRQRIKKVLCHKAQGMFRWVSLQLQYLRGMKLETAVRDRLGHLPRDLRKVYHETLDQKLDSYEEIEKSVTEGALRLLLCVQKPFSTQDFVLALSCSASNQTELCRENILDLCSSFVVIDDELDVFRFAHLSVREFLEGRDGFEPEKNDALAAQCCLNYLSTGTVLEARPLLNGTRENFLVGFHRYACFYWPFHLDASKNHRFSPPLQNITQDFMIGDQQKASSAFICWNDALRKDDAWRRAVENYQERRDRYGELEVIEATSWPADCIYVASKWGFCDVLEFRIMKDPMTLSDSSGCGCDTALSLATRSGNLRAAQKLIENGAVMEHRHDSKTINFARWVRRGLLGPVSVFLDPGANAKHGPGDYRRDYSWKFPFHKAAESGCVDILRLLLECNVSPDVRDVYSATPLDLAAANGHEKTVQLLLDNSTIAEHSAHQYWKKVAQLQSAMRYRGEVGLRESLRTWPTCTQATQYLGVVLWKAAENKDEACIKLLLARGANTNTVHQRRSVLEATLFPIIHKFGKDQLKVVKLLLDHGADPNVRIDNGNSTLIAKAAFHDDTDLVRLLADAGANVDVDCPIDRSPLRYAVISGSVETARFLLEKGADVEEIGTRFFAGSWGLVPRNQSNMVKLTKLLLAYATKRGMDWTSHHQAYLLKLVRYETQERRLSPRSTRHARSA